MRMSWLLLLRAYTPFAALPMPIVTHGEPNAELAAKPTFWNGLPVNVATNSIERPGPNVLVPNAAAPDTVSLPPATVAVPPPCHGVEPQPGGRDAPEKSALTNGASVSSPSPTSVIATLAIVLPCANSAAVWSSAHAEPGVVKLAGAAGGSGDVAALLAASAEVTR